jgi:hypothetical protein
MSSRIAKIDLGESGYYLRLRPMVTRKEDRDEGRQHWAFALWLQQGEYLYEICAISGIITPEAWAEGEGSRELLETAKREILMTSEQLAQQPKDQRRELRTFHARWLGMNEQVEAFTRAIDAEIAAR